MKRLIFLLWSISLLLTTCDMSDPLLPEKDVELKLAEMKMTPIKGEIQSHVTETLNGIPVFGTLSGNLSHLGKLISDNSTWYTISVEMDEQSWTIVWEMFGSVCAANGDFLKYTLNGSFNILENKISGEIKINGGTGRFSQAQGSMDFTGCADDPSNITTMYMHTEGIISNVGSSHGDENPLVEQNESIAQAFTDAWDTHDTDLLTSLLADEFIYTEAGGNNFTDKTAVVLYAIGTYSGAPDSRFETISIVANEQFAAVEWMWKGTNTVGWPQMGIPATNVYFELPGVSVMEIENGKIVWVKDYWDLNEFLELIGVL